MGWGWSQVPGLMYLPFNTQNRTNIFWEATIYEAHETFCYNCIGEVLYSISKMAPKDPVFCCSHLCIFSSYTVPALISMTSRICLEKWYVISKLDYKRPCGFHFEWYLIVPLRSWTWVEKPYCKNHSGGTETLFNNHVSKYGTVSPAPVKPSDNYSLSEQLDCKHMRDLELETLS